MPQRLFKFTVDPQGQFHYDPPGDWAYGHTDQIRFQSDAGPFTLDVIPLTAIPDPSFNPLGAPLQSVPLQPGTYVADTAVTTSLTATDRETIRLANMSKEFPEGFISRYRYVIAVSKGGKQFSDSQKNGVYSC